MKTRLPLTRAELAATGVLVALVVALPILEAGNNYVLGLAAFTFAFAVFAMGMYVMVAWAGEIPLGLSLFYGVGAYGTGILMKDHGWTFIPAVLAAIAMSVVLALVIGLITLRLTGAYFSIVSWGIAGVGVIVANNLSDLTGGALGLFGIPTIEVGPWSLADSATYARVTGVVLVVVVLVLGIVRSSSFGVKLNAARVNDSLARAIGIDTFRARVTAFSISAALAAFGGALTLSYVNIVTPQSMTVFVTVDALLMVLIGGTGFLLGPILGAAFFKFLPEQLDMEPAVRHVVFSALIIVVMLVAPGGLPQAAAWLDPRRLLRRQRPSDTSDAADGPDPATTAEQLFTSAGVLDE